MTVVKICGITEMEQALQALEAGADQLGFVLAPSRRQLHPEVVAGIVQGARRRFPPVERAWQAVGVFANQPLELVLAASELGKLDVVQLSGEEPEDYCRHVRLDFYKVCHLGSPHVGSAGEGAGGGGAVRAPLEDVGRGDLAERLGALRDRHGATRLLLDSGRFGQWGGTGQPFPWDLIGVAAQECMVAGGLSPANVAQAIAVMRPWGVDVSSGVEREGRKDPLLVGDFIAEVRRWDDRADE